MKKILVVEDDEDIRELLHYNLKQEGFQVRLAENGPDGLSAALRESVDLVVTEYGVARLKHLPLEARARALIEIAAPQFRDELKGMVA